MRRLWRIARASLWTDQVIWLASALFLMNFGLGLIGGASTNFFVDTLGLSGSQVLWLAGIREIPGLMLIFIAALSMHLPLARRAAVSVLVMGIGYGLYALVQSYSALIAAALFASLGFHNWLPLRKSLAMNLASKEKAGRILGSLSSVSALASIVGMGVIALSSRLFSFLSLRAYYVAGGALVVIAAGLIARLHTSPSATQATQPRLLLKRRYWLYYVLTFFEGSRTQVFGTFGTLVLVQYYGLQVWEISLLLVLSGVVNFVATPLLGTWLDRLGERVVLSVGYVALALCFVGYATLHHVLLLAVLLIAIRFLVYLEMGLSTYVNRIAPSKELVPTLSAGVSVNHITSVTTSLLAGTLLHIVGYEALCFGAATIIMLSVPFAMALKASASVATNPSPSTPE